MAHDVFISYAHDDKLTADAICATLEGHGIRCWIAPRDVVPGEEWAGAIIEAIHHARIMVLVFSSHSNQSTHVMREVERAVSRGLPILPFRIEGITPSRAMEYFLSSPHWLDALTPPLENHLKQLVRTTGVLLAATGGATRPADVVDPRCPACGHDNRAGTRFCANCGAATPESPPAPVTPAVVATARTPNPGAAAVTRARFAGRRLVLTALAGGVAALLVVLVALLTALRNDSSTPAARTAQRENASDAAGSAGGPRTTAPTQPTPTPAPVGETAILLANPDVATLDPRSVEPANFSFVLVDGEYVLKQKDYSANYILTVYLPQDYDDATLSLDARSAGPVTSSMSLACRRGAGDESSGYRFTVYPANGTFTLSRYDKGREFPFEEDRPLAAIQLGDAWNRLALSCIGKSIVASVNGTCLAARDDTTYKKGSWWFGPALESNQLPASVEVRFAHLLVTRGSTSAPVPVLLADSFNDPPRGMLTTSTTAAYRTAYSGGEYLIEQRDPAFNGVPNIYLPGVYADVTLAIDVRLASDAPSMARYVTLSCRNGGPAASAGYRLTVYPASGTVTLMRLDPGSSSGVRLLPDRDWPAAVIKRGGEWNHLELTCAGGKISGSANGTEVGALQDATYTSGTLWFGVSTTTGSNATIDARFDNLVVSQR